MTSPTHVPVAGLLIPAELVPRIITALRSTYGGIVEGLDDEAVVRKVLKYIIETTLTNYEAGLIEAREEAEVERVREEIRGRARQVREKARRDAGKIEQAPSGEAEPNVPVITA